MATRSSSTRHTAKQNIAKDRRDLLALQRQRQLETKQFNTEAGSIRGATNLAVQNVRASNLGGLRGTPEGRQLQQEYRSRAKSLIGNLPFALAPVQREHKTAMQGISTDIGDTQFALQQHQQDLLKAIKDQAQTIAQNKADKKAGVDNAYKEALRLIHEQEALNGDSKVPASDKRPSSIPTTEVEWNQFFDSLSKVEGVDRRSATKAVKRLQRRLAEIAARGSYGRHQGPTTRPLG